jgi:hypothetical protein
MQEKEPQDLDAFDVFVDEEELPPVHTSVTLRPDGPSLPGSARDFPVLSELPHALIYSSKDKGTGNGHVVIVQANDELTCICWPALRSKRGCHAMVAARELLGLPPVD